MILNKYDPTIEHLHHDIIMMKGSYGPHHYKMTCKKCNKFIKWATKQEYKIYKEMIKWQNK